MLFIFALPVMQVILFCLAIGRDPTGLKLAIVNHEMNGTDSVCQFDPGCTFENLSCRYLSHLNGSIVQEYYPDQDTALKAVRDGNAWGALYFTENFTDALVARIALGELFCSFFSLSYSHLNAFSPLPLTPFNLPSPSSPELS